MKHGEESDMWEPFSAQLDGQPDRKQFSSLVDAMGWIELHDKPTGVIQFLGAEIVRYSQGDVDHAVDGRQPLGAKKPMFLIATEHKTREQMKADARQALQRYQQASPVHQSK